MVGNIDIICAVLDENEINLVIKFQHYHKIQTFLVTYHSLCFRLPICTFFNIWYKTLKCTEKDQLYQLEYVLVPENPNEQLQKANLF